MNKTVNINLAGIFFHIDEDAYLKLQRYLEAIKRSFTDSQGRSEIIADIEARIAELFNERVQNEKQVIRIKEVDEVISIMGQPEDYLVDDEIFEDEPKTQYRRTSTSKKLFRDTDNSYIGGVSSGLGHYLGIDAIWVRLLWILLTLGSGGTFVLIYVLFWVLVPEAVSTADKLTMTGEPVNISNIEKKIKDGFDNVSQTVSDTVKNIDLPKQGNRIKSSSKTFFDTIGDIIMFCLKVFAKFIGIILIIIGASTLIGLIIALFTVGIADSVNVPGIEFINAANAANTPVWLVSMLLLFAIGIPFFFIFYLGLKILINNLKSIGNIAKFSLLGLWLMSMIGLFVIGIKQASEHAFDASVTENTELLMLNPSDTLTIRMQGNSSYSKHFGRRSSLFKTVYDENDNKLIYNTDVRLIVRSTKDSVASLSIEKNAHASDYQKAKSRAQNINYDFKVNGNELLLDAYLTTEFRNKYGEQQIEATLYLPEGTVFYADQNTYSFHRNSSYYRDILENGMEEHYLKVTHDGVVCLNCEDDEFKVRVDVNDEHSGLKIDEDGVKIKKDSVEIEINDQGIRAKDVDVKVRIDDNGVEIISDDN
ncbi:PspC domain-containing protein [Gaetbulibacter jejuensis]|uniref:PspC domain-containing protein n=1 Tax=Gaetbulibacter jejuensis TaxID=584607 RepID=UPI0030080F8B